MKQGQDEFNKRGRAEWIALIDEWVHSEIDRKILVRAYLDGLTLQEIAEEVNLTIHPCEKRLKTAREQLFSHVKIKNKKQSKKEGIAG